MNDRLNILWTNADEITSELMVLMYAPNTLRAGLWKNIRVIIWGATAKLVAENTKIQNLISEAKEIGVEFSACRSCTDRLEVSSKIQELDIELKYWGEPLTEIIKTGEYLITI